MKDQSSQAIDVLENEVSRLRGIKNEIDSTLKKYKDVKLHKWTLFQIKSLFR